MSALLRNLAVIGLLLASVTLGAKPASAVQEAFQFNPSPPTSLTGVANDVTLGWRFSPTQNLMVTALGYFDDDRNGLLDAHDVGIFRVSDEALLVSTTVSSGTAASLTGDFRYASVAPTLLLSGVTYVIGGFQLFNSDTVTSDPTITANPFVSFTNPSTTYIDSISSSGLSYPGNAVSGELLLSTNFQFATVPAPASASLVVGALGIAAALMFARHLMLGSRAARV